VFSVVISDIYMYDMSVFQYCVVYSTGEFCCCDVAVTATAGKCTILYEINNANMIQGT